MFTKTKRKKLSGKDLQQLNQAIFDRDNQQCIVCGCFVSSDNKFHHEPIGVNKSDEVNKGVVLCFECHQERHFGKRCIEIKTLIVKYLRQFKKYLEGEENIYEL